jgi:hypothetical protein
VLFTNSAVTNSKNTAILEEVFAKHKKDKKYLAWDTVRTKLTVATLKKFNLDKKSSTAEFEKKFVPFLAVI